MCLVYVHEPGLMHPSHLFSSLKNIKAKVHLRDSFKKGTRKKKQYTKYYSLATHTRYLCVQHVHVEGYRVQPME